MNGSVFLELTPPADFWFQSATLNVESQKILSIIKQLRSNFLGFITSRNLYYYIAFKKTHKLNRNQIFKTLADGLCCAWFV
jgi:hypothetical protein